MSRVIVIGGGASGMMAAIAAAEHGHEVSLFEKNEKLGKKLYITGKGRCNLTNNCEVEELLQAVCTNRKFLYSAFYGFTSQDTIAFFEKEGLKLKTERGNRVFPQSDHSSDVIAVLAGALRRNHVRVFLGESVSEILTEESHMDEGLMEEGLMEKDWPEAETAEQRPGASGNRSGAARKRVCGVRLCSGRTVHADAVIVATGGLSYPSTGSTGDGYRFAESAGHTVTECMPSLVPLETAEAWTARLQGLSLRNVSVSVNHGRKEIYKGFGEMMFTHFGVTGPLILTMSSVIKAGLYPLRMEIDLKPALTEAQLDARILREFEQSKNKQFKNSLSHLFPSKLIPVMVSQSGVAADKPVHDISREERSAFVSLMKHFPLTLTGPRGYNEAVITRGGVSVKEIHPATMESRLTEGLYFAGEVLDLDAVTGGFNLQIAWATGYAAGCSAGILSDRAER